MKKLHFAFIIFTLVSLVTLSNIVPMQETYQESTVLSEQLDSFLTSIGYTKILLTKKTGAYYAYGLVGNQPVCFLIDTGSDGISLLSDGLKQLGVHAKQSDQKVANMTGGVAMAQKAVLQDVVMESIAIGAINATIMDQPFSNDVPTIVIGNDFLLSYNAILDCVGSALYLNKEKPSKQDQFKVQQLLTKNQYQCIPLTQLPTGHLVIAVQIHDSMPVYFLFDTGTSHTTLADSYVRFLGIQPNAGYHTQDATNGTITYAGINIDTITFNPLQSFFQKSLMLRNLEAVSANIESVTQFLGVVGVLGIGAIEALGAVIVMPTRSVFIAK